VVVLATDGRANTGIEPMTALKVAQAAGVKVYTIGVGKIGGFEEVRQSPFGGLQKLRYEEPDEKLLTAMAEGTGGQYFRATDADSLENIYARISALERREVKVKSHRDATEHYFPFLLWGALLLAAEAVLRLRIRLVV
jgi:Ca-activated chloride channel family protein